MRVEGDWGGNPVLGLVPRSSPYLSASAVMAEAFSTEKEGENRIRFSR